VTSLRRTPLVLIETRKF